MTRILFLCRTLEWQRAERAANRRALRPAFGARGVTTQWQRMLYRFPQSDQWLADAADCFKWREASFAFVLQVCKTMDSPVDF